MDSVSIEIPSDLFVELYQQFEGQTQSMILAKLRELVAGEYAIPPERSMRPKSGTITARVWEIADEFKSQSRNADRTAVVQACIAAGINMNTANTQFSHWSKENQRRQ